MIAAIVVVGYIGVMVVVPFRKSKMEFDALLQERARNEW